MYIPLRWMLFRPVLHSRVEFRQFSGFVLQQFVLVLLVAYACCRLESFKKTAFFLTLSCIPTLTGYKWGPGPSFYPAQQFYGRPQLGVRDGRFWDIRRRGRNRDSEKASVIAFAEKKPEDILQIKLLGIETTETIFGLFEC